MRLMYAPLMPGQWHELGYNHLQVVGPKAAELWLASTAGFLQLRYHFVHCADFDAYSCPSKAWLLSALGTMAP